MNPTDLSPLYQLIGSYNIKINDREMSQNLIAPAAWALAVMLHKPKMVIEIGTSKGGMSALLADCVAHVGGEFHTFDIHGDGDFNQYPLRGNATFHLGDCFDIKNSDFIDNQLYKPGLAFLLCDGGNKVKEWNLFKHSLKSGDIIGAHDWCDETMPKYSPDFWIMLETPTAKLNLEGMELWMDSWFHYSAWCVRQKL